VKTPRAGWTAAFAGMAVAKDDFLVQEDAPASTQFDEEEWEW
jgi:hypothetical protein